MKKLKSDLKPDGILCVTVPPPKHEIVGGHVSVWNAGLLMYRLVLAGFNCSNARIKKYGYNISLILPNSPSTLDSGLPDLHYDTGDIDKLKNFFPLNTKEGFNGDITELNW